ncbi:MAG: tetratricopeptide repeat protein [Flavobacteriales bacterium]|nr:tetratricopeptide repeat protein [Flavobacteriales bacterium]
MALLFLVGACGTPQGSEESDEVIFGADSTTLVAELNAATEAVKRGDHAVADSLVSLVLDSATTPSLRKQRMMAYSASGLSMQHQDNLDSAEACYHMALDIATRNHAIKDMAATLTNLGTVLEQRGDYVGSLEHQTKALALKEDLKDSANMARSLNNIGLLQLRKNDTLAARATYQRALAINERTKDSSSWSKSLASYAVVEMDLGRHDTALVLLKRAYTVRPKLSYGRSAAYLLGNMGLAHEGLGREYSARWCYEVALQQAIAAGDRRTESGIRTYLADLLIRMGQRSEGAAQLEKVLALSLEIADPEDEKEALLSLARLAAERKDYTNAYHYNVAYNALADSLMNAEKDRTMSELLVLNEVERKERENADLRAANALAEMRTRNSRTLAFFGCLFAVAVGAVAWLLFQRSGERAKRREAELEQQALRLQMDPHFLFNALNTIPGLYASTDSRTATAYVGHLSNLLRLILETSRKLHVPLRQEIELLEHYLVVSAARHAGVFNWSIEVDPDLNRDAVMIPPMLLQPLVENAILHGLVPRKQRGTCASRSQGAADCWCAACATMESDARRA